jgi:transcriptional regulator with XRE-family HTH domain
VGIKENIKSLRLKHGLSQKELADIAGVSDKAVSTWELGTNEPRMGAIQKIADHFGILKSDIIEDVNSRPYYLNPEAAKMAQEIYDNPQYKVLFDATKKLKPESIKEVMKFIDYQKAKEEGDLNE